MNKLSLYVLLILLFLGLSKSFSLSSQQTAFVTNKNVLSSLKTGAPLSLILVDMFDAGFLIKTYYLKFKVIHGFKSAETLVVRTHHKFWQENKDNISMSLFRRHERDEKESTVPLPPGSIFVGNQAFGGWKYHDSGKKIWQFHKVYRHFPKSFNWQDFRPSFDFFKSLQVHEDNSTAFYGLENEFGTGGTITEQMSMGSLSKRTKEKISIFNYFKSYIKLPKWTK
jgi:hypothetical protein